MSDIPNRLIIEWPGLSREAGLMLAVQAVRIAQSKFPKLSGAASRGLRPVAGQGWWGVGWNRDYVWFQEMGIDPFTMKSLAGKVIPMWIDDPTGTERRKNPRAKTRVTASGKTQVLIFRRAAHIGERKTVVHPRTGRVRSVPKSYPGAPGRIGLREHAAPHTREGKKGGQVVKANVGVRWRHPGLTGRLVIHHAMTTVANRSDMGHVAIVAERGRHR